MIDNDRVTGDDARRFIDALYGLKNDIVCRSVVGFDYFIDIATVNGHLRTIIRKEGELIKVSSCGLDVEIPDAGCAGKIGELYDALFRSQMERRKADFVVCTDSLEKEIKRIRITKN